MRKRRRRRRTSSFALAITSSLHLALICSRMPRAWNAAWNAAIGFLTLSEGTSSGTRANATSKTSAAKASILS